MSGLDLVFRSKLFCSAFSARRARARKDSTAYIRHIARGLDLAISEARMEGRAPVDLLGGPIVRIEPISHTHGGFFNCLFETAKGRRFFAKAVRTPSRESMFWNAWQRGAIRTEGRYYRIHAPVLLLGSRDIRVLIFPENKLIGENPADRRRTYHRHLDLATLSIADFNSDHLNIEPLGLSSSHACGPNPLPHQTIIRAVLPEADPRTIRKQIRDIERRWPAVKKQVYSAPVCLCHMDMGPGNVSPGHGISTLMDFGCAAIAPIGSDLHAVFRYSGQKDGWPDPNRFIHPYTEVFASKGITVDPVQIRCALDAHFAARYRNLNKSSARKKSVFDAAMATSLAMIGSAETRLS